MRLSGHYAHAQIFYKMRLYGEVLNPESGASRLCDLLGQVCIVCIVCIVCNAWWIYVEAQTQHCNLLLTDKHHCHLSFTALNVLLIDKRFVMYTAYIICIQYCWIFCGMYS